MNWLDLALLVFLLIFAGGGLRKGLIRGVFEIVGLAAAIIIGGRLSPRLVPYLLSQDVVRLSEAVAGLAAFLILFVAVLVCFSLSAHFLRLLARAVFLAWFDRLGGLVLGLAVGLVFASLLLTLATYFPIVPRLNRALDESTLARPVQKITPRLLGALREGHPYFDRWRGNPPKTIAAGSEIKQIAEPKDYRS